MGQVLPGSARTRQAIRRAIQRSQESLQSVARRHGINAKTVAKWRKRTPTQDAVMGPQPASTVLSPEEDAAAVAFRQHTQRPLDDCLSARQATLPRLTRSALHRLFPRHGIRHLPLTENGQSPAKKKFKAYPMG
jgi:transposase-like protein